MPISPDARPLPNSEMPPLPGSRVVGQTDPASRFTITIALRPRRGAPPLPDARHFMRVPPGRRLFFTPALLAEHFGASPEDAAALRRHLEAQGLVVEAIDLAARNVRASGTVRQMSDTFGITFHEFERPLPHPRRRPDGRLKRREPTVQIYRGYTGAVLLPGDIVDAVQAVFGLSNVRLGGSNMPPPVGFIVDPMNVIRVAEIYRFPGFPTLDASGQSVAILMINGSTDETPVRESVNDYFTTWVPTFTNGSFFSFDSTSKLTFHRDGPTIAGSDPETVLDVCVAATVAQKASITVYQRVDTVSQSTAWLDALDRLIADNPPTIADGTRTPSLGRLTFPLVRALVAEMVTVSEDAIREAVRFLFERTKLVVEPSGALGVAALLSGAFRAPGQRVGVILSGGNIDPATFCEILRPEFRLPKAGPT